MKRKECARNDLFYVLKKKSRNANNKVSLIKFYQRMKTKKAAQKWQPLVRDIKIFLRSPKEIQDQLVASFGEFSAHKVPGFHNLDSHIWNILHQRFSHFWITH